MERRRYVFASEYANIENVLEVIETFVAEQSLDEEVKHRLLVASTEAATNAMRHGNRFDPLKDILLELEAREDEIVVTVEDEGNGFSPDNLPDPLQEENLLKPGGRGVYLMNLLADNVEFTLGGRCVRLRFKSDAPDGDPTG